MKLKRLHLRSMGVSVFLTVVALFTQMTLARTANATTIACASTYGSKFAGYISTASGPGGSYEGASAVLVNNSAPICDDDPNRPRSASSGAFGGVLNEQMPCQIWRISVATHGF